MGYSTDFYGSIKISSDVLPKTNLDAVATYFADELENKDIRESKTLQLIAKELDIPFADELTYIDYAITKINSEYYLVWTGSEKSYDMCSKLEICYHALDEYIRHEFRQLQNYDGDVIKFNGVLLANGEDHEDIWFIVAKDSVIERFEKTEFLNLLTTIKT